ncbi:MAG: trimethylamine methyltransferase family protein [Candidatus Bathyarchaeia archaeon]
MKFKPLLKILDSNAIDFIHEASLEILEKIGLKILNSNILKRIEEEGAIVDYKSQIVKFPHQLVIECVKKAQKQWVIHARNKKFSMKVGFGELRFQSSGGQRFIVDPLKKTRREGTKEDLVKGIKLGDALKNINIVGPMVLPVADIHPKILDIYTYVQLIKNSSKVVFTWINSAKSAFYIIKIFEILAGGEEELRKKPMIWYFGEPTSPLTIEYETAEIIRIFAEKGFPITFGPMVMSSITGPATLAGTLALENAEILGATTMAQLINYGVPIEYGGIPHIFDQKSGNISFGSPEQALMAIAMTQIGRYYGFPVHINVGLTDAKIPDAQSGLEKGITMVIGAMAGAELFGHLGIAGMDQGASLEQLMIDNEIIEYVKRIVEGFDINNETIALDVISKVGPGGSFLTHPHTFKYVPTEFFYPKLCDRKDWFEWKKAGAKDLLVKANEEVLKLIAEHCYEPLDKDIETEIEHIFKIAQNKLI